MRKDGAEKKGGLTQLQTKAVWKLRGTATELLESKQTATELPLSSWNQVSRKIDTERHAPHPPYPHVTVPGGALKRWRGGPLTQPQWAPAGARGVACALGWIEQAVWGLSLDLPFTSSVVLNKLLRLSKPHL